MCTNRILSTKLLSPKYRERQFENETKRKNDDEEKKHTDMTPRRAVQTTVSVFTNFIEIIYAYLFDWREYLVLASVSERKL